MNTAIRQELNCYIFFCLGSLTDLHWLHFSILQTSDYRLSRSSYPTSFYSFSSFLPARLSNFSHHKCVSVFVLQFMPNRSRELHNKEMKILLVFSRILLAVSHSLLSHFLFLFFRCLKLFNEPSPYDSLSFDICCFHN